MSKGFVNNDIIERKIIGFAGRREGETHNIRSTIEQAALRNSRKLNPEIDDIDQSKIARENAQ